MTERVLNYETLAERIGTVVINWNSLEGSLKAFLYDLASYNAAAFEEDDPFQVLIVFLGNMDMRQAVANAKALAHRVKDPPDFYERAETLLNRIDNEFRNERHRYVHDIWRMWGPIIHRIKSGVVVRREPSSGERKMHHHTTKQYLGTHELAAFAKQLKEAEREIGNLGDELRQKLNEIRPLPK